MKLLLTHYRPGVLIIGSLITTILFATGLLSVCTQQDTSFVDLLFTAASALSVTGFFTIPLHNFSHIGQMILLLLIQIGGLGVITLTLCFIYSLGQLDLATHIMASKLLDIESWKDIKKILIFIGIMTLSVEVIGAIFLLPFFINHYSLHTSMFLALFHSISGFCNAGVLLIPTQTIVDSPHATIFILIMMSLIAMGGLGFISWLEIVQWAQNKTHRIHQFSLHTRLTLAGSIIGIVSITSLIYLLEQHRTLSNVSQPFTFLMSLFYSISWRSAGFIFHPIESFSQASQLLMMITGFIGSASLSTGSGIKITTMVITLKALKEIINDKYEVSMFNRTINNEQVQRAIAIVFLSIIFVLIASFTLLISEHDCCFGAALFQVVMAYANLGITTPLLVKLSFYGKLILIISMIIGRVGSLTLIISMMTTKKRVIDFSYPEEKIMLG